MTAFALDLSIPCDSANLAAAQRGQRGRLGAQVRLRRGAFLACDPAGTGALSDPTPARDAASADARNKHAAAWREAGFPPAVVAAYEACRLGAVRRAHLVDARLDGGMLLELYRRDGVGTMISADFYEGIRRAGGRDVGAVKARDRSPPLLAPTLSLAPLRTGLLPLCARSRTALSAATPLQIECNFGYEEI